MKKSTRMMLMSGSRRNYDVEDRGYRRYSDGRFAPRFESEMWVEDKFRDRRGREHYDNGRYAPMSYYDEHLHGNYGPESHYRMTPYVPPVYQDGSMRHYDQDYSLRPMNKIGFSMEGEMNKIPPEFSHDYRGDEMAYRRGGERVSGHGYGSGVAPFSKEMAEEWTREMKNEDGTTGPHWTMEQTNQIMTQRGINCDPAEFYAAMNMVYSDYSKVAKKLNVSNIDFYAEIAKAFLDDQDAAPDKLARYYEFVVKH